MIICDRGVSNLDMIAKMRYADQTDWYGNQRSVVPRLPMTKQAEKFYTDLLEKLCIRLGDKNAPRLLTESSGEANRIELYYGDTGCEETKKILSEVALNEYGYCVKDRKIFIYGHTMQELKTASERFLRIVRKSIIYGEDNSRTYDIADDAEEKMVGEPLAIMNVPAPDFGENALFCDGGVSGERMWVVSGCSESDYKKYLTTLENAGFCEYETNEIKRNLYATYTKVDIIVDAWYTKDGYVRISASKGYNARPLHAGKYDGNVCTSLLTMPGMLVDKGGGQMCLIFRLSDGRFVIIDSAIPYEFCDNILAILKAQAPAPENIVVASWLFTHNHGDHVCGFNGMCHRIEQFRKELTVESFIYNFPGAEQGIVPWQCVGVSNIPSLVKTNFSDAKVYRALPGNTFEFANMKIEVLASHESYVYDEYPNNTNACNVFYRIYLDGQIINIPGDTSDYDHEKLVELYGDYLKCDILQASHHGGEGSGTVESAVEYAPKTILILHSSGIGDRYGWEDLKDKPFNQQLIDPEKNPNYEEHFVMSDNIYYFPLPYEKGKSVRYTWTEFGL